LPLSTAAALCDASRRHLQSGELVAAEACCSESLEADGNHVDSLNLMGTIAQVRKDYRVAIDWHMRAIRKEPKAEYIACLGMALQGAGLNDEALKAFDRALRLEPDNTEIRTSFGNALKQAGRIAEAAVYLPAAANGPLKAVVRDYLAGRGSQPAMLEIGAGPNEKPGWLASDLTAQLQARRIPLDATKSFPLENATFDYVFSEHMIEHVPYEGGHNMLKESFRILKPGGIVRIVTPSLGFIVRIVSSDRSKFEQGYFEWFLRTVLPDAPIRSNAFFFNIFVRDWGHTFIYDHQTLRHSMQAAGFTDITTCTLNQSSHRELANLENTARMPPGYLELESMVFEGRKA
jgi:predicted SAM-dependent methyltransferase